ncbi:copper chaperone PCu(A)C [Stappia stellulata]|uniref:copper chaperone PCu(A)C n=1 Tax=Stappia stellulata TaxID=71235 RepID=UPI0004212B6F|nr:copper chaperone PCu(A)C [Stappia stellulata]
MTFFKTLVVAAALATASLATVSMPAVAEEVVHGDLTLSGAWTRATPPRAVAGGGFVTIVNAGEDDRLVSATANVSDKTELHEMAVIDGVMKMREMADGIPVPAGGTLELKPGSYHVMFLGLNAPLVEGETVPVTLTFEKAGAVDVSFTVEKIGAKGMGMKPGHGKMNGGMKHGQPKN